MLIFKQFLYFLFLSTTQKKKQKKVSTDANLQESGRTMLTTNQSQIPEGSHHPWTASHSASFIEL